jgi:hypothetical protein
LTLWNYTLALARRRRPLIAFVAIKLRRARVLDGPSIDRIVRRAQWLG